MIGVIAALETEVLLFQKSLENIKEQKKGKHIFHTGEIEGKEFVFAVSGVGKVNATICTQLMIDHFNPKVIINTGIAGALSPDLKLLDTVIGTNVTYHDVTEGILESYFPFKSVFQSHPHLIKIAKEVQTEGILGAITTGDQFINDKKIKDDIYERTKALCVEMEGGAIAHTAFANNKPFLVIRTISDLANDEADIIYEEFEEAAAKISSKLILQLAEKLDFSII